VGICNIRGVIIAEFIIDTEDMEKVKAYGKWCMSGEYVGSRRDIDKGLRLHRFIMNCPDGLVVNHWNHNKLDCRKINLVVCTSSDNNYYSKKPKGTKYPYKGVFYAPTSRRIRKWCAQFGVNYKKCVISSLNDMEEAAWIYDQIIMQIAGEFAYTNFKWDDRNNYIGADGPDMLV
jgi:hypothetical protein